MKAATSYLVESDQGSSVLHYHTVSDTFAKRVEASRHYKAMRKKWIYVRFYQVVSTKTLIRSSK